MIRAWLDQELNSMQVQTDHSIQPSPTTLPRQDNEPALIHIPEVHRHFPFFLSTRHKSPTKLAARVSALSKVCESFRLRASTDTRVHIPISLYTRQCSICLLLLLLCLRSLLIFRLLLQDWIDPCLKTAHDQLCAFGCNFNHVKAVFLYGNTLMCIVRHT